MDPRSEKFNVIFFPRSSARDKLMADPCIKADARDDSDTAKLKISLQTRICEYLISPYTAKSLILPV